MRNIAAPVGSAVVLTSAEALAGNANAASLSAGKKPVDKIPDGHAADPSRLRNAYGMPVNIVTYGDAVQSIKVHSDYCLHVPSR